jgi:hypothetical protein
MTTPSTGPQNTLPEFKPKGMSKWDKIMMWILIFVVVLFGLGMVNRAFPDKSVAKPVPKVTVTAPAHKATAPSAPVTYVVQNKVSGYIWWLDNNGSPFTQATATKFAKGHPTYIVFSLKKG